MTLTPILILIDLQEGLVNGFEGSGPRSTPDLALNVEKVLQHWRAHKWPIIHIHHDDLDHEHPLHKVHYPKQFSAHTCSTPQGDEPVLFKHGGSAFVQPELRLSERLDTLNGKENGVVMMGMDGAQCVNDNTRSANDLGFKVTVVADACASFGMEDYRDPKHKISAEDTHVAAMSMLANGFATVLSTEDCLRLYA